MKQVAGQLTDLEAKLHEEAGAFAKCSDDNSLVSYGLHVRHLSGAFSDLRDTFRGVGNLRRRRR